MNACPVCGSDTCSGLYQARSGEIVGCTDCVDWMELYEAGPEESESEDEHG